MRPAFVPPMKLRELPGCVGCSRLFLPKSARGRQMYCSGGCRFRYWVSRNRPRHNAAVRAYRARRYQLDGKWRETGKALETKQWIEKIKSGPCVDCGASFPSCCMDFDHRPGTIKSNNVGTMVAHHHTRSKIELEISKCDLVCSNCHRIRTRNRRTGSGLHAAYPVQERAAQ